MDRKKIMSQIADEYIAQCKLCITTADVKSIIANYDYSALGYANITSMKAAVSKQLLKKGFKKKQYALDLVRAAYEGIVSDEEQSKDQKIKLIQADLNKHNLKYKLIRDYLQELGLGIRSHHTRDNFNDFMALITKGHSFHYAVAESGLTAHTEKKAQSWFISNHGGDERETLKYRRREKKHCYLNLKDYLILNKTGKKISRIWTAIGFSFADGCVQKRSVQLVITKSDGHYLSEFCIPSFLDESIVGNSGPELIEAHSDNHETSFDGSKPVFRGHLDDSHLAAFLSEIGMPSNKIENSINLSEQILTLPDKYFFCFLAGLFAGDGCFTRQKKEHLHLSFDIHCENFCKTLATQIESRSGVPMSVYSHLTKKGVLHFKLSATTSWRALSLMLLMLFYAPYHLKRKTDRADLYLSELIHSVPSFSFFKFTLDDFEKGKCSESDLNNYLKLLKNKSKQQKTISRLKN
jgi:hypothetical protein